MRFRSVLLVSVCLMTACAPTEEPVDLPSVSPGEMVAPDGSIMQTLDQSLPAVDQSCEHLKQAESNTIFSYHDQQNGVTFDVPYNPEWLDNAGNPLLPVEKIMGDVVFGTRRFTYNGVRGICEPRRDFSYAIHPRRSASAAEKSYESEYVVNRRDVYVDTIGDHTVTIMQNIQGACPAPLIEVVGIRDNLLFTVSCGALEHIFDPVDELTKIIRTVHIEPELL